MAGPQARAPQRDADGRACSRSLLAAAVAVAAVAALASVTLPRSQPPAALDAQQSAPALQPSLDPHASPETPRYAVASGSSGRRDQAQPATAPPPRNPAAAEYVVTGTDTSPPQHYVVPPAARLTQEWEQELSVLQQAHPGPDPSWLLSLAARHGDTRGPPSLDPAAARFAGVFLGGEPSPGWLHLSRGRTSRSEEDAAVAGELQPALRNFTLSQSQQERFRRDGFVVVPSNGGSGSNFVDSLHDVFANDLPVFLSADAVLHAIHVTFDDAITTLERRRMIPLLQEVLDSMSGELEALAHALAPSRITGPNTHRVVLAADEAARSQLRLAVADMDYYLTVARSLMAGKMQRLALELLSVDQHSELALPLRHVRDMLKDTRLLIKAEEPAYAQMFGEEHPRLLDFSQLIPRGHYTKSPELAKYFATMMWLGQVIDFRLAPSDDPAADLLTRAGDCEPGCAASGNHTHPGGGRDVECGQGRPSFRQTAAPVLARLLLRRSGAEGSWRSMQDALSTLFGHSMSLSLGDLDRVLGAAKETSNARDVASGHGQVRLRSGDVKPGHVLDSRWAEADIEWDLVRQVTGHVFALQRALASDDSLASHAYEGNARCHTDDKPRVWRLLGRRFAVDGFAASRVVFDHVPAEGLRVRRAPSELDIGFTVFGNTAAVAVLARGVAVAAGVSAAAVSGMVKRMNASAAAQPDSARDGFAYAHHAAATHNVVERSHARDEWQCTSVYNAWLSVLRSMSGPPAHSAPLFQTRPWRLRELSSQLGSWTQLRHDATLYVEQPNAVIFVCEFPDALVEPRPLVWSGLETLVARIQAALDAAGLTSAMKGAGEPLRALQALQRVLPKLRDIAETQADGRSLSPVQLDFMQHMVSRAPYECGGPTYGGWFPSMFPSTDKATEPVATVADVHTAPPQRGQEGIAMHMGVGNVDFAVLAVPSPAGDGRGTVFVGPVFSTYQFDTGLSQRVTDRLWAAEVKGGATPKRPAWADEFVAY